MEGMTGEVVSALAASLMVSPMVAIVDKAIFSNTSGKMTYVKSITESAVSLLVNPKTFFKSPLFLIAWSVYAATYTASNCSDRFARLHGLNPTKTVLIVTSATSLTVNVIKDRYFTRFCAVLSPKPVPLGSFICFVLRDLITITSSFTIIEPVADFFTSFGLNNTASKYTSQMICPPAAQLINTPLFIYGMDLYNRPGLSLSSRWKFIKKNYWQTFYWGRMARIGPAYSIGGSLNMMLRSVLTPRMTDTKLEKNYKFNSNKTD